MKLVNSDAKEKTTFVVDKKWYSEIFADCTDEEKAWFLDSIFIYQLTGEIRTHPDRFMNSHFKTMVRFFDMNSTKYMKTCLIKSINKECEWAKRSGDTEKVTELTKEKEFLNFHTLDEYSEKYKRIQLYTTVTDNDSDNDTVNESVSVNDSDSETGTDYDFESVSDSVSDFDSVPDTDAYSDTVRYDSVMPCEEETRVIYTPNNLQGCEQYLSDNGIDVMLFIRWLFNNDTGKLSVGRPLGEIVQTYKNYEEAQRYKG